MPMRPVLMTGESRSRALVCGAVVLLSLLGSPPVVVSAQSANLGLPADLVAAVVRDLRISPREYLRRAELSQRVAEFSASAARRFPHAFAGGRLDDSGNAVVAVVPGVGSDGVVEAVRSAGFDIEYVVGPHVALTALPDITNVGTGSGGTGSGAPGSAAPAAAIYGGDPYVIPDKVFNEACSFGFNGTDKDGDIVNISAGHCIGLGGWFVKDTAIYSLKPGTKLKPIPPDTAQRTDVERVKQEYEPKPDTEQLGVFKKVVFNAVPDAPKGPRAPRSEPRPQGMDYSIIKVADGARNRFQNNRVRGEAGKALEIDGVAEAVVGMPVCKSGAMTGWTCGHVLRIKNESMGSDQYPGDIIVKNAIVTDLCGWHGDSGGAAVTGKKALGIMHGGSTVDEYNNAVPTCRDLPAFDVSLQPIKPVLDDNSGLEIRTS
ncbi:hypothetical protein JMUB6875_76840 [Nocardia sp. JMUB6875]|uniref:S1 family peptidase n=1 Tax=Nocardia sp. JMUB6875 TaxID=3158170 RepID=UPI0032E6629E